MFSFDIKEIFQRKIVETLITLLIIHIGTVVFSFIVRWVHPHLKNYVARDKKTKSSKIVIESCESRSTNNTENDEAEEFGVNDGSLDGHYIDLLDSLKSFVDVEVADISSEVLGDECIKYTNSLNNLIVGIEETVNLRRLLRHVGRKNHCSSEAQTNISIHPKRKLQCLLPELILSHVPSSISVTSSAPSDQFDSASSGGSDYTDVGCKYAPGFCKLDCSDNLKHQAIEKNVTTVKFESTELHSKFQPSRNFKNFMYTESISKEYGRQVSLENKILETAIVEFEKELKPIKDQIRVLKECLNGFGSIFSSEVSSSITGTVGQSESLSQVVSSTCSSDLSSPFSDTIEKLCDSAKDKSELNFMMESLPVTPVLPPTDKNNFSDTLCNKSQTVDIKHNLELKKSKKRSHLAEMYVKLSNCNSQPSNCTKSKNCNTFQCENSKAVTCRINLNLNLGTMSFSSNHEMNCLKKQKILPLLSEPEDLFNKAVEEEKPLKPAKLITNH